MTEQELIAFEKKIMELWEAGELPYLLHFSGGNERRLIDIFKRIDQNDYVLSTHRNHYHYLLHGGPPDRLEALIRAGKSMFVYDQARHFLTSSIVAGTPAIAAGLAKAIQMKGDKRNVWCFVGDGAEDEGHFYEAVMYVAGNNLPCTFIVEDNDRSVSATKDQRRGIQQDHERIEWPGCVIRYRYELPWPHAGNGTKKKIVFKETVCPDR